MLCCAAAQPAPIGPSFEIATIKPSDLNGPSLPQRIGHDTLTTRGPLKSLILLAYTLENYQVEGGPAWTQSEFYDVQAKASSPSSPARMNVMLQRLLTERFHLQLDRETRTMNGYVLVVDKRGPKLPAPNVNVPPDSTGVIQLGGGEIWSRASTMKHLATALHYELEVPVRDETNIDGHYDFKLRFDEGNRELADPNGPTTPGAVGSVFTALHEIGLRLEPRKLPIEVLIIRSAEKPSGN
jgi:uncharacterized protein (TIGR03435 family)